MDGPAITGFGSQLRWLGSMAVHQLEPADYCGHHQAQQRSQQNEFPANAVKDHLPS
jgi:hypothetical protein